jgi:hypothetical protein
MSEYRPQNGIDAGLYLLPTRKKGRSCSWGDGGHLGLLGKALSLDERIVQLGVSIADLLPVDEELKPFRHAGKIAMPANIYHSPLNGLVREDSSNQSIHPSN